MNLVDFLFSTAYWPQRWRCGTWTEALGYTHIIAELMIWGAYMTIPLLLVYFIRKRKDFPFHRVFFLFAAFIVACGFTHLIEAIIFYYPVYRFLGLILIITALVSWGTVIALVPTLPKVLALPSLENVNTLLKKDLGHINERLEVAVHTLHAGIWDWDLKKDRMTMTDSLIRMLGIPTSMKIQPSSKFLDLIYFEDRDRVIKEIQEKKNEEGVHNQFFRMHFKDQEPFFVQFGWKAIFDSNNQPHRIIGTVVSKNSQ